MPKEASFEKPRRKSPKGVFRMLQQGTVQYQAGQVLRQRDVQEQFQDEKNGETAEGKEALKFFARRPRMNLPNPWITVGSENGEGKRRGIKKVYYFDAVASEP